MVDYRDKIICAPMVKISSLPFRLLCLKYGCDLVYTEELIDYKLIKCKRFVNDVLGTIDYKNEHNQVLFRTCEEEKRKVILQIVWLNITGTNCPDRALMAAKIVEQDVAGIDINMGCPKSFSLKGGMGAALLDQPKKIEQILTNLVKNLSVPVTCKIRVFSNLESTLELVKMIESTGVAAIAVHGRTKVERQQHKNRTDYIKSVVDVLNIPVIANGESSNINTYDDITKFKLDSKASSVMVARSAEHNCSIFRKDGKLDRDNVVRDFLDLALKYDACFSNTKYTIQNMLGNIHEKAYAKKFLESFSMREICEIWKKEDDYDRIRKEFKAKGLDNGNQIEQTVNNGVLENNEELNDNHPLRRKRKLIELDNEDVDEVLNLRFIRNLFERNEDLPKSRMHTLAEQTQEKLAYRTFQSENKRFYCICEYAGKKYLNTWLQKNKKQAEQAGALVACLKLNLIGSEIIEKCNANT